MKAAEIQLALQQPSEEMRKQILETPPVLHNDAAVASGDTAEIFDESPTLPPSTEVRANRASEVRIQAVASVVGKGVGFQETAVMPAVQPPPQLLEPAAVPTEVGAPMPVWPPPGALPLSPAALAGRGTGPVWTTERLLQAAGGATLLTGTFLGTLPGRDGFHLFRDLLPFAAGLLALLMLTAVRPSKPLATGLGVVALVGILIFAVPNLSDALGGLVTLLRTLLTVGGGVMLLAAGLSGGKPKARRAKSSLEEPPPL
jgi:hypothetical protein